MLPAIGVTGHQTLESRTSAEVERMISTKLRAYYPLLGLSALAAGADQLFARCVLKRGGRLVAILASDGYDNTFTTKSGRYEFRRLLSFADEVVRLDFPEPSEQAFLAAGKEIVDRCDVMFAVWDGKPAGGLGGTADIVKYARTMRKPIEILWPSWGRRI